MPLSEYCASLSVPHGMFQDRCVVYVCLKNLTIFIFAQI